MRKTAALALILVSFIIVGALYAIFTPDWQAPDEPAHFNYVRQLAAGSFPVIEPGDYNQEYQSQVIASRFDPKFSIEPFEYEDYQPPLYYLLQTPVYILSNGSLQALRLFSVLLGAGVVILTYFIARQIFPNHGWLALTAAVFVAFLPQHVSIVASVNNDSLAELLIAGILLTLINLVLLEKKGEGAPDKSPVLIQLLLGLLLGFGLLTKASVYITVPLIGLVIIWIYWNRWRDLLKALAIVFGLAILLGLGWWIRNSIVYGGLDILGTGAHNAIVVGQPRTAEWIAEKGLVQTGQAFLQTTFQSFWGQFGWMGVVMPRWVYGPLLIFSLLTVLGIVAGLLLARRDSEQKKSTYIPPMLVLVSTFALSLTVYLVYNLTFVQHQGRYLFSALVPIGIGVAIGWSVLLMPALRRYPRISFFLPLGLAILLVSLDLLALFRFIVPSLTF
jgi:4-amino-4-deoxy-L-arabinose transferase-like glycosyltransferase